MGIEHGEGRFSGCKNCSIYYQYWLPPLEPRAILLVVHGMSEHSGRYVNVIDRFLPKSYAVYGLDHRGNGKSDGLRGYVEYFSYYLSDLKTFFDMVRAKHPDVKIFMIGHSMGGTIAIAYAVHYQHEFDGLILSGASLKAGSSYPVAFVVLVRMLSLFVPKTGIATINASAISQDKAVVDAYVNDPLVYQGKIRTRLGSQLINVMHKLPHEIPKISLPILIMHGMADQLSNPKGSKMIYDQVGSRDKTIKLYEGFWHEIFNEPGSERVFKDMETWLDVRI